MRRLAWLLIALFAAVGLALAQESAPSSPALEVHGVAKSGSTLLPGVTISATHSQTAKKVITSTDVDGTYRLVLPEPGKYLVRAELTAFAAQTTEVVLTSEAPSKKADFVLVLLSRAPKPAANAPTQAAQRWPGTLSNARGTQRLAVSGDESAMQSATGSGADSPLPGMPSIASSPDAGAQSVAVSGQMGASQDFGMRSLEDLRDRIEEARASGQPMDFGGGGFGGGPGGGGTFIMGGPGGFGGPGGGGMRGIGRFNANRPHGSVFYSAGNSALNAEPYSLNGNAATLSGTPQENPDYGSNRFGFSVGGPLIIPHVYNGANKDFLFLNYTGSRSSTSYVAYSTVPTADMRNGNFGSLCQGGFSAAGICNDRDAQNRVIHQLYNPLNGTPFLDDVIPLSAFSPAVWNPATQTGLLSYIPTANQLTGGQNFRYAASPETNSDNVSLRWTHNFTAPTQQAGTRGQSGGGGRGGGGNRAGRVHNNLNVGLTFSRNQSDQLRSFNTVSGTAKSQGWNANIGWSVGNRKYNNTLRVSWNVMKADTTNRNTGIKDVAGTLKIEGASTSPSDYGVPGLSFADYSGLSDVAPSHRIDQTFQISEAVVLPRKKHNIRLGGDYRRLLTESRSNSNANGTFTFTGFSTAQWVGTSSVPGTGYDFADFLLGYAQQATLQYSSNTYHFRANSFDAFIMDDWRVFGSLTINAGLRYEYQGPYTEADNRLVNLELIEGPGGLSVTAVRPGYHAYPASLVNPDRNNFAPRVGLAWKMKDKTVVRAGYGINYNLGQYRSIVSNLALQPPFSETLTNSAATLISLPVTSGLTITTPNLTNNYGVDPNYRLGYVQMWNLNIQRELPKSVVLNVGYTGSKGTGLDLLTAPNRTPTGLLNPDVQAFLYESSGGSSILHSGSVRVRKRMHSGIAIGGTYVYSKSIDNASSIGGSGNTVAQDATNLQAERGLSSFDQRHKFTGDWTLEFPFGTGKRWLDKPSLARYVFGDWTMSGDFTLASGAPYTARVLGNFGDVARGSNGSLRANYSGASISLSNPTQQQWFNTAAFTVPAAGTYGTAGRNTIIGPGSIGLNMALSKDFQMKDNMALQISAQATNVLNHINYTGIDTTVNSRTFGQVISVGTTRRITMNARFRF